MIVDGNTLIFDTDAFDGSDTESSRITIGDDRLFGELIMTHPNISTIVLVGGGGNSLAAEGIARKIMEFDLDTVARNRCASSCATIFLAGRHRQLEKGGWLCFHRASTTAADFRGFFQTGKDSGLWQDEFDFASEVFDNGQISTRDYIAFLLSRGVSIEFALKTLAYSANDAWCPTREELERHGVLHGDHLPLKP
ncbi:MAG: hypothetical protein O9248_00705 [Rhodobacteraceae bacterium]|nr:hypothetical protein [Paracoccaceae bacterium]